MYKAILAAKYRNAHNLIDAGGVYLEILGIANHSFDSDTVQSIKDKYKKELFYARLQDAVNVISKLFGFMAAPMLLSIIFLLGYCVLGMEYVVKKSIRICNSRQSLNISVDYCICIFDGCKSIV